MESEDGTIEISKYLRLAAEYAEINKNYSILKHRNKDHNHRIEYMQEKIKEYDYRMSEYEKLQKQHQQL